jgi:hypothetical protein
MKKLTLGMMTGFLLLIFSSWVQAGPIVTYTVSGTTNNWILDFSITNSLNVPNLDLYQFGIAEGTGEIVGSPTNWAPLLDNPINIGTTFPTAPDLFVNIWTADIPNGGLIKSGETVSGFIVRSTSSLMPQSVEWYAIAFDYTPDGHATYSGNDYYFSASNPLFVGTATATVPEYGSTLLFLSIGIASVLAFGWKLKN